MIQNQTLTQTNENDELSDNTDKGKTKFPPKVGDLVKGIILASNQDGIYVDLSGLGTGIVRGRELMTIGAFSAPLTKGSEIETTVLEAENEKGLVELSLRYATHKKAWENIKEIYKSGQIIPVKVTEANKGGLIVEYYNINGFLPVSQLKPENYPRVKEGDKIRILEKLKSFIGQTMMAKIITFNEADKKIVFSEKQIQELPILNFKIGEIVDAKVTGMADFGAFVGFGDRGEGLIHISEIAWKRIEKPEEILKIGDTVKAKIINLTKDNKASLSIKALSADPWKEAKDKYHVGQIVKGKIIKINPFGLFVSLDENIHGLAHISEIPLQQNESLEQKFAEDKEYEFKITSLEPEDHRLSLSFSQTQG